MARTGSRSHKHEFRGNQHTQRSPESAEIEKPIGENATIESASERKIKGKREVKEEKEEILGSSLTGYRLMDAEILADVLRFLCCQECGESKYSVMVIPRKLKLLMNFFETFPECSLPSIVSKNTIKMIGHHSHLRDAMGQSYLICACTCANHARYSSVHVTFCGSTKHSL